MRTSEASPSSWTKRTAEQVSPMPKADSASAICARSHRARRVPGPGQGSTQCAWACVRACAYVGPWRELVEKLHVERARLHCPLRLRIQRALCRGQDQKHVGHLYPVPKGADEKGRGVQRAERWAGQSVVRRGQGLIDEKDMGGGG